MMISGPVAAMIKQTSKLTLGPVLLLWACLCLSSDNDDVFIFRDCLDCLETAQSFFFQEYILFVTRNKTQNGAELGQQVLYAQSLPSQLV